MNWLMALQPVRIYGAAEQRGAARLLADIEHQ